MKCSVSYVDLKYFEECSHKKENFKSCFGLGGKGSFHISFFIIILAYFTSKCETKI